MEFNSSGSQTLLHPQTLAPKLPLGSAALALPINLVEDPVVGGIVSGCPPLSKILHPTLRVGWKEGTLRVRSYVREKWQPVGQCGLLVHWTQNPVHHGEVKQKCEHVKQ